MSTLERNDVSLACSEQGSGPPVVLVHGSASDMRTWQALIPALAEDFRVIAYSRRFHLPNPPIAAPQSYDMQQHVDDLAAVVEGLGRGRAHLVGHSYGAYVALVLALQQPERVASLVLAEPPVIPLFTSFPPRGTEILRLLLTRPRTALSIIRFAATGLQPAVRAARRGDLEGALRYFGSAVLGADRFAAMSAERRAQARENLSREELLGDKVMVTLEPAAVAALTLPVLLVGGDCSPALFKRLTDHLQRLLPDASRIGIPGASHNLHEDAPDAFNRAVGEFLRRVDQSPVGSR